MIIIGPGMGVAPGVPLVPQRVWSEHQSPGDEGKVYYYNKVTRQSSWEKPKDFDLVMPLPADLDVSEATPTSFEAAPISTVANIDQSKDEGSSIMVMNGLINYYFIIL